MIFILPKIKKNPESGQALIMVMLLLIVIAIIATGVAVRTINDTRRTGRERASADAFEYTESALASISNQMSQCLSQDGATATSCIQQFCGSSDSCTLTCEQGQTCSVFPNFNSSQCTELALKLKASREINGRVLLKDEAMEFNVGAQAGQPLNIDWEGKYLSITFISQSTSYYVDENFGKYLYRHNSPTSGSGLLVGNGSIASDGHITITPRAQDKIIRIRALGAPATLDITGFVDPAEIVYSANGFCGNVSKSQVLIEPVLESMDGIFDYVLYSNVIEKDLPGFSSGASSFICGNGVKESGEQCDDGNTNNADSCTNNCTTPNACGNGTREGSEQCDDGNFTNGDGCSSTCQSEIICGNGKIEGTEQCDDGNTSNTDSCSTSCVIQCPSGWTMNGNSCYRTYTTALTWANAEAACQAESANLVSITSSSEQTFVSTIVGASSRWTGLNDTLVEGVWRWTDGSTYSYSNWGVGQPDNWGDEDCGSMRSDTTWNDNACSSTRGYICEKTKFPVSQTCGNGTVNGGEECDDGNLTNGDSCSSTCKNTCPSGWTLQNGSCYQYYSSALPWPNARVSCQSQAADLVKINNATENTFVANFNGTAAKWIGATDASSEGNWRWADGSALSYTAWAIGEPNNSSPDQDYGWINHLGVGGWDDHYNGTALPYICEK